ncbi:MAG TPA: hypothetical protein VN648_28170 [Candidatus Methylomirabilis sp.]|nr:hypothetical protein [Candidatus Methylomirabilis sp.]
MAEMQKAPDSTFSRIRQHLSARVVVAVIIAVLAIILIDRGYEAITLRNRRQAMIATNDTPADDDSLETVEVKTEGVDEEGNLVIDDLVVAADREGKILATDETVAVITPEGDVVVDEKLSVLGEDGKLHDVEEDIAVMEVNDE